MREIAESLALDRATVSVIANGNPQGRKFAPATVERVQSYLREIGYAPPKGVLQIRGELPSRLGILHSGRLYSHLTQAFNLLVDSQAENNHGAEVVVRPLESANAGLRELVARGVDRPVWIVPGSIGLAGPLQTEMLAYGKRLRPVIYNYQFTDRDETDLLLANGFSLVGLDRKAAYRRMARLLGELGHREVLLGDVRNSDTSRPLEQAYIAAMESQGIRTTLLGGGAISIKSLALRGAACVRRAFAHGIPAGITAVCFRDDEVAVGALCALLEAGIRVPEDVTVVGMDGHPLCPYFRVPLTTLAVPVAKMVERTLEICANEKAEPSESLFDFRLVRGTSHGPPRTKIHKIRKKT